MKPTRTKTRTLEDLEDVIAKAMAMADEPLPEFNVDLSDLDYDLNAITPPPAKPVTTPVTPACSGRKKISLRLPYSVLKAFSDKAEATGTRYQTLITKTLKDASSGW
jgi:predicted DNA binding CopG/RHH family protein